MTTTMTIEMINKHAAFSLWVPETGHVFEVFANGEAKGFPAGVVFNRIPLLVAEARVQHEEVSDDL
jgi:hypothetical protein